MTEPDTRFTHLNPSTLILALNIPTPAASSSHQSADPTNTPAISNSTEP